MMIYSKLGVITTPSKLSRGQSLPDIGKTI